jgi:hypothetical protein
MSVMVKPTAGVVLYEREKHLCPTINLSTLGRLSTPLVPLGALFGHSIRPHKVAFDIPRVLTSLLWVGSYLMKVIVVWQTFPT